MEELWRPPSYVLLTGTSPAIAMRVHERVRAVVPDAELLAPTSDRDHYGSGGEWGIQLAELDTSNPLEDELGRARERYLRELPGGAVHPFVDPLSWVVVTIATAVLAGIGQEVGKSLYGEAKKRRGWLTRRLRIGGATAVDRHASALARLFDSLGLLYDENEIGGVSGGLPILVRVLEPNVIFVSEPDLPRRAITEAARLVTSRHRRIAGRPLRWNLKSESWRPLPESWSEPQELRRLSRELRRRTSNARRGGSSAL